MPTVDGYLEPMFNHVSWTTMSQPPSDGPPKASPQFRFILIFECLCRFEIWHLQFKMAEGKGGG